MRVTIAALVLLGGCSPFCLPAPTPDAAQSVAATDQNAPVPLTVSVKDLMGGALAFSAHVVEQILATDAPLTSADWGAVRSVSGDLMAAATLLTMPNNNAIDNMRRQDGHWRGFSEAIHDAGGAIAVASAQRDRDALKSAVNGMREACRTCHAHYGVHGQ